MFNTCPHTEIKCTSKPGHMTDDVITLNLQNYLFYGKCFSWTSKLTKFKYLACKVSAPKDVGKVLMIFVIILLFLIFIGAVSTKFLFFKAICHVAVKSQV